MERLTKKSESGMVWFIDHENDEMALEPCEMNSHHSRLAIQGLANYEDLEEQGLLKRFPCKVGDTVYVLVDMDENGKYTRWKNDVIESIYQNKDSEWMIEFRYIWHDTELCDIGKTVFLTQEQAEEALVAQNRQPEEEYDR